MFAATKSRRREPELPCPCGNVCRCHQPSSNDGTFPWIIPIGFPIIFPGLFILIAWISYPGFSPPVRHIEVDGQDCIIQYHSDGVTSTGAGVGHDIALCPK
jgi:hypothetical protein